MALTATFFTYKTPVGQITIAACQNAITHLGFGVQFFDGDCKPNELTNLAANQLQEYFARRRSNFDLPLQTSGSEFQEKVWEAIKDIPYGQTRTYQDIADLIYSPTASRAIGVACNKNPIPIIIPCHRIILSNGRIGGYVSDYKTKSFLLNLEEKILLS